MWQNVFIIYLRHFSALVEAKEKYAGWQKAQEEKAEKDLEKLSKKPAAYKHLKVKQTYLNFL